MRPVPPPAAPTCFFERDPELALSRRATAEGVNTLLLMLAATGSGLAAQHLSRGIPALGLMASAVATASALAGLIVAFGPVSGGHLNPLITVLQWLSGERRLDCTLAYVAAQLGGGIAGALLASAVLRAAPPPADPVLASWTLMASEVLATAGLMIVVFGCARGGRAETGPFAVGGWVAAATIATPSTCYANPAVTLGALFAAGPIALPATTVLAYEPAEVAGALLALLVIAVAYPVHPARSRPATGQAITSAELSP